MLLTLLAGNLNAPRAAPALAWSRPARPFPPDDTIYTESRRGLTAPLLFWRNVLAETEVGAGLYQTSFRPWEEDLRHTRTDHQLFFQIARQVPAVTSQNLWQWQFPFSARLLDAEPDYARANHQV